MALRGAISRPKNKVPLRSELAVSICCQGGGYNERPLIPRSCGPIFGWPWLEAMARQKTCSFRATPSKGSHGPFRVAVCHQTSLAPFSAALRPADRSSREKCVRLYFSAQLGSASHGKEGAAPPRGGEAPSLLLLLPLPSSDGIVASAWCSGETNAADDSRWSSVLHRTVGALLPLLRVDDPRLPSQLPPILPELGAARCKHRSTRQQHVRMPTTPPLHFDMQRGNKDAEGG